ncbi:MAG TPA: hypothetical protein VF618_04870 [Thermoanaerobaculia bacterium]
MKRLFGMHFRRMFIPLVAIAAVTYFALRIAGFVATRYAQQLLMGDELMDILLLLLAVACAYPAGAVPFSRTMKERHVYFFHMLPIPRRRMWLTIAGASLAALVAMQLLIVLGRPALLTENGQLTGIVFAASLVLFSAGVAFALSLASTLAVYVIGLALLIGTAFVCSAAGALAQRMYGGAFDGAAAMQGLGAAALALAVLAPLLLLLAARAYERGENLLARTQLTNMRAIALACGAVVLLAALVPALPLPPNLSERVELTLAPDGRRVAVLRRVVALPFRTRVQLVELESGDIDTIRRNGVTRVGWNRDGALAMAWKRWHPLLSWSSRDAVVASAVTADLYRPAAPIASRLPAYAPLAKGIPREEGEEVVLALPPTGDVPVLYAMTTNGQRGSIWRHEGKGAWTFIAGDIAVEPKAPRYGATAFQRPWSTMFDYKSGRVLYASGDRVFGYHPDDRTKVEICRCQPRMVYLPHRDVVVLATGETQQPRMFLWRDGAARELPFRVRGHFVGVTPEATQVLYHFEEDRLMLVDAQGNVRHIAL